MIKLNELQKLLGYKHTKSVKRWCCKRKIPVIRLGKLYYVRAEQIDVHLQGLLSWEADEAKPKAPKEYEVQIADDKQERVRHSHAATILLKHIYSFK